MVIHSQILDAILHWLQDPKHWPQCQHSHTEVVYCLHKLYIQGCNTIYGVVSLFWTQRLLEASLQTQIYICSLAAKGFSLQPLAIGSNAGTSFGTSNLDQICLFLIVQGGGFWLWAGKEWWLHGYGFLRMRKMIGYRMAWDIFQERTMSLEAQSSIVGFNTSERYPFDQIIWFTQSRGGAHAPQLVVGPAPVWPALGPVRKQKLEHWCSTVIKNQNSGAQLQLPVSPTMHRNA